MAKKFCRLCGKKGGALGILLDTTNTCRECAFKEAESLLPITPDKSVSLLYETGNHRYAVELRIDDTKKQFALSCQLANGSVPFYAYRLFDYSKLRSVQLEEDGQTVISSNAGKALAGGLLLGGLGAMMGASGSRTTSKIIKSSYINLIIDDIDCPRISIPVFETSVSPSSGLYKKRMQDFANFYDLLVYVMGQESPTDQPQTTQTTQTTSNASNNNPYEEIKQLKELLDIGAITQEEFDAKKKQLLGI